MKSEISRILQERQKEGLLRTKKKTGNTQKSFTSNDFLGLGTGSGGSRLLMNNSQLFDETEELLSKFKGFQDSLIFSSGYSANLGLLSAFSNIKNTEFYIDRLSHASIIDGVIMSGHKFHRYKHADCKDLKRLLSASSKETKKIIVTESIFSMDGDFAPIDELIAIKKEDNALLFVDDAHSTGVYGKNLAGISANYEKEIDAVITTFGKGMGLIGAAISADKELISFLVNFSRSFIYSTALPPQTIQAIKTVIMNFMDGKYTEKAEIVKKLSSILREELQKLQFDIGKSQTHIIPIIFGNTEKAEQIYTALQKKGFFTSLVRPPTVPNNSSRLRIVINANHCEKDIKELIKSLVEIKELYR